MSWDGNEFGLTPGGVAISSDFAGATDNPVVVSHVGGITHSPYHVRVNSTFLHDHSTTDTENVGVFGGAFKYAGSKNQTTFGSNFSVCDRSNGGKGAIVGNEIDVYGQSTTMTSLGQGVYAKSETGRPFAAGNGYLVDSDPGCSWARGHVVSGNIRFEGYSTWMMKGTNVAFHVGHGQVIAWDGATPGQSRAWFKFNNDIPRWEFYIDGAIVGHFP